LNKKYGTVTMTEVLENSINTGMIWVEEKIGPARFKDYVEKFGFGKKTGIGLDTESAGDISSFSKNAPIYNANASFGQGFMVTPIQLAAAYSALANGGRVVKPRVIDEIRYPNGRVEKFEPETTGAVISPQTQKLINGMLISVIDNGSGYKRVKLDDYYVAGKTGTAQIAKGGKYSDESNHTFVGYFPATNPRFVLFVKYEAPQRQWAESTAAPVFKDVAKFLIDYYGIPPER
jgi:stage V sporulation protein D (sporulation-specific penicillin-binding protein)